MGLCRHCQRSPVNRPRGMCWACYYAPGLRERYPSTSKFAARGVGHRAGAPPAEPTRALPGTDEKVAALARRVERGEGLWHSADARRPIREAG